MAFSAASPANRGAVGAGRTAGISRDAHAANRHAPSTCCHTARRGAGSDGSFLPPTDSPTFTRQVTTNASPTRVARTPLTVGAVTPSAVMAATSAVRSKAPSKLMRWKFACMPASIAARSLDTIFWNQPSRRPVASVLSPASSLGHAMAGAGAAGAVCMDVAMGLLATAKSCEAATITATEVIGV